MTALKDGTHGTYARVNNGVPLLSAKNVIGGELVVGDSESMISEEDAAEINRASAPQVGDVLLTIVGTIGRAALYRRQLSVAFQRSVAILRPRRHLLGSYLRYCVESDCFQSELLSRAKQAAQAGVYLGDLAAIPVPVAPIAIQCAIADFLDEKTAAIDALIAKKERLIALLQDKRQALITQAVTKGLDPTVPMKDSGVEWLGEIPAHWEVKRLKHLMSHIVDCPHSTPEYSEEGEYPAIRTADLDRGRLLLEGARRVVEPVYRDRVQRLVPAQDDILYSREGERFGMAALVPPGVRLCLAQRMMMFRTTDSNYPAFVMWLLNSDSLYQQVLQDTVGATSPRINIPTVNNAWIAAPSRPEQAEIARRLAVRLHRLDRILALVSQHCATLREYRQALITEAVTGKLDIAREAARDRETVVNESLEAAP